MDPNTNRNSMGSRAGGNFRNNLAGGAIGAPSRLGTAGRGNTALGGVGSTVNVQDRPISSVGGINGPQGVSMQRQVYDKNYYVNKIKQKLMSISEETDNLRKRTENTNKEQQLYNKLESRRDELIDQVRNLQGTLADYNITLDKLRINTRPEDVKYAYGHVKNQNDKLKSELDQIFIQRKKLEEQVDSIRSQLTSIHQQMDLRLNELDPSQRGEYQRLMSENNELIKEYNQKQNAMQDLLNRLANSENRLKMDNQKLKGQILKQQIEELQTKKTDYAIQLNQAGLSIPEARDRILARMKQDNQTITQIEKMIKDAKKNIDVYEKRLRQLDVALEDKKTQEEDKKRYELLYKRDKQMDQFLNSFDQLRQQEIEELNKIQQQINEQLQKTSKLLEIAGQLPNRENVSMNRGDRSQNTLAQAKTEYQIRVSTLRALENAQKRTQQQSSDLKASIQSMRQQIKKKFDRVEQIKQELNKKKSKLASEQQELQSLKTKIAPNVNNSDYQTNIAQKKYQMHDSFSGYSTTERNLQKCDSQLYYLKHYINTKSKDTNFEDIKNQCMAVAEELNKMLVR